MIIDDNSCCRVTTLFGIAAAGRCADLMSFAALACRRLTFYQAVTCYCSRHTFGTAGNVDHATAYPMPIDSHPPDAPQLYPGLIICANSIHVAAEHQMLVVKYPVLSFLF